MYVFFLLMLLGGCSSSPPMQIDAAVSNKIEIIDQYPTAPIFFSNGVTGIPSLNYKTIVGFRPLELDLYLPPKTIKRPPSGFPWVVFIHGGGGIGGDRRRNGAFINFPEVLSTLAAKGYVVASISYRLSGEAIFPAQIQDVKAAIKWLRSNASKYQMDPNHAMTWGVSSGGHLAALAALSCKASTLAAIEAISDCVEGAVAWFGIFNIATLADQAREVKALSRDNENASEWQLLGCFSSQCQKGEIELASPINYVDKNDPPIMLIVGDEDKSVPFYQTTEMADRLLRAGVNSEAFVIAGVDHHFIGKSIAETREANLKALTATFAFFDKHLKTSRIKE